METLTTTTLTTEQAAVAGGVMGAMLGTMITFCILFYILQVIANWRIFEKAGEKGWKALIPIYNTYIMFKIVDMKNWFWGLLAVSICGSLIFALNGVDPNATTEAQNAAVANNPLLIITSIVGLVVSIWATILYAIRTAKVFGKGGWFAVGLIFLTPIFWFILAFGKAKYNKKNLKK